MVSATQIKQYREAGYAHVRGLFSAAELDRMEAEFDGILARRQAAGAHLDATWAGNWKKDLNSKTEILHTHDVQGYSAEWTRVLIHRRLMDAFAALMGSENIQLHHTKLFLKPPEKGSPFPMHQDYPYFPHAKHTMMAGIIHLSDATIDMGCLRVVPGSHKLGPLETFENNHLNPKEYPVEKATPVEARRGDVAFFNYLTVHGSGLNISNRVRKTVLIQVRDPSDPPLIATHASLAQGMILRGIDPLEGRDSACGVLDAKTEPTKKLAKAGK